jgi:hypothetical protein
MTSPTTVTTLNGETIPGVISGITVHTWTAEASGLYTTSADLGAEWAAAYATVQSGNGNQLNPLQRLEANAQAVLLDTKEAKQSAAQQDTFREDAQREFDAIYAAMQINLTVYGIDPNAQFNTYTYLKLEETLQDNPELETLGLQGHGLNQTPNPAYTGYTEDIQNDVDNKTYYVGGGVDNGQLAIADFFDDVVMSHAPFPAVWNNGTIEQLNQNGNFEDPLTSVVSAANAMMYTQVLVASDFSTNSGASGAVVAVPDAIAAPAPPTPPAPLTGVETLDGSTAPETIAGLTVHTWIADATGLYGTVTDLGSEWKADEAAMLAGDGGNLTPLQRLEGNAEAVLDNTGASKMTAAQQTNFRLDAQREFDAIDAAMRIDQSTYGTDPNAPFTATTYLQMEQTLQSNEALEELAVQGHGLNSPPSPIYDGYTEDFQNRTDGSTYFVGGGSDNGELAIADFFDDDILTHAAFPVVWHNGVQEQLNQNGNFEDTLATVVMAANSMMFDQVLVASDFSTNKAATGQVVAVPTATAPPVYSIAPLDAVQLDAPSGVSAYTFTVTRSGDLTAPALLTYAVAGSGGSPADMALFTNPNGSVSLAAGASSTTITLDVIGALIAATEGFTVTLSGPAGTDIATPSAAGAIEVVAANQATVTGAGGAVDTLTFATAALAAQAQIQLSAVSAAIASGAVSAVAAGSSGSLPNLPTGISGLAEIDAAGNIALPAGYTTVLDLASGPVSAIAAGGGNQLVIASGSGALTYGAAGGTNTVYAGGGNALVFGGSAALDLFGGTGVATIIGGTAGNTIAGGAGETLLFASGAATYDGGTGAATVIGGGGPLAANLGAGGGVAYGAPGGGNVLNSGGGTAILVGGGQGDQLIATGGGADLLAAGGGAETLNGSAATGNLVLFGGAGADCIVGGAGSDVFLPGPANATLTGGGGTNAYVFTANPGTARIDTITDFNPATNAIDLFGYGSEPGADAAALASAVTSGSITSVFLPDGTTIVLLGAPSLSPYNFF